MTVMKKVILRTRPIHLIVISAIGLALFIFMFFIPLVLKWHDEDLVYKILWYIIMTAGTIICLYFFLSFLEFAIVQDDTLIIRKFIFFKLVELPLEKIQYVFIERLSAQPHLNSSSVDWITLCLDKNEKLQERKYGGNNKKGKSSWQIMATSKNLEVLRQYFVIDDPWGLLSE